MNSETHKNKSYSDVVSRAELKNILLTSSTFKASSKYNASRDQDDVNHSLGSSVGDFHFDQASSLLVGEVHCNVLVTKTDDKTQGKSDKENSLFSIKASYLVIFDVPGNHGEETVRTFFSRMAPFAVWPYFRSHVAHLASEAKMDVPILPIRKLIQTVETAGGYVEPQVQSEDFHRSD